MANSPYTARKQARLFFDLETCCNLEALALMPEPVVTAPANYKDPVKIAEYVQAETERRKAELIDKAALDPDLGKILSIGFWMNGKVMVYVNRDIYFPGSDHLTTRPPHAITERDLIATFWNAFSTHNGCCVGYNVLSFDLPFLLRRSMALGVKVPFTPNLARFRSEPVTDLMCILYNWGSDRYKGLKQVAKLYGLPVECEGVDGSMVANLDVDTLMAYQTSDVKLVMSLYERMNGVYFNH